MAETFLAAEEGDPCEVGEVVPHRACPVQEGQSLVAVGEQTEAYEEAGK